MLGGGDAVFDELFEICKGKDATYRQEIGHIVYNALVDVGVPKDDRFQVIGEHSAEDFLFDSDYLGIHRTEELVVIQITWNEGRSIEQKKALYKAIADGLHSAIGLRREDVFINLIEVKKENWSYGNGEAQYALGRPPLVVRAIAENLSRKNHRSRRVRVDTAQAIMAGRWSSTSISYPAW